MGAEESDIIDTHCDMDLRIAKEWLDKTSLNI